MPTIDRNRMKSGSSKTMPNAEQHLTDEVEVLAHHDDGANVEAWLAAAPASPRKY